MHEATLSLSSGKLVALYGRSGSGKSTLLNMLSGLLAPTMGRVLLNDMDVYQMEDLPLSRFRNQHFGVIPQGQAAIMSLTVLENVLLPGVIYGAADARMESRGMELLEETGIGDLAKARPAELSGGEMRRMSIARALLQDPDVILADEPTADLDDENTEIVLGMLKRAADQGKIVLMATHDKETFAYADEIYRMDAGIIRKER